VKRSPCCLLKRGCESPSVSSTSSSRRDRNGDVISEVDLLTQPWQPSVTATGLTARALALLPNHVHVLLRTGPRPLGGRCATRRHSWPRGDPWPIAPHRV